MYARYPVNRAVPHNAIVKYNPITQVLLNFHSGISLSIVVTVIVLIIFILVGRGFCGWVCPIGAGLDIINKFFGKKIRKPRRDVRKQSLQLKYRLFICGAILLFAGVSIYWLLDPTSMFTRNTALIIDPIIDGTVRAIVKPVSRIPTIGYPIEKAMRSVFNPLPVKSIYLWLFLLILLVMFSFEIFARRFFCKVLCPLGAMLGYFANLSPLKLEASKPSCTKCHRCLTVCKTQAMELHNELKISHKECILCLACREECAFNSLSVLLRKPKIRIDSGDFKSTRRDLVFGIVGAAILLPLFKFGDKRIKRPEHLIRPPGAIPENRFSQVCAKCGSCMKVCYTSGLQPTLLEYGVDNLFTPRMINTLGFCGYECNDCGKVCPTGAIAFMPLEKKRGAIMGIAKIDNQICWPWAEKKPCITCEEMCPIPQKAIEFEERPVTFDDGTTDLIKLPHVVKENCTGCGICENHCPVRPIRAIRVVYEGETRGGAIRETPPRERRVGFTTNEPTYWK